MNKKPHTCHDCGVEERNLAMELLETIRRCEEIVSSHAGTGQWGAGLSEVARCELSSQLRAAIAKATGDSL
jgi:hypothetical protein